MNRLFVFIFSFALIGLSASAQQPEGQNAGQGEQVKRRVFTNASRSEALLGTFAGRTGAKRKRKSWRGRSICAGG